MLSTRIGSYSSTGVAAPPATRPACAQPVAVVAYRVVFARVRTAARVVLERAPARLHRASASMRGSR